MPKEVISIRLEPSMIEAIDLLGKRNEVIEQALTEHLDGVVFCATRQKWVTKKDYIEYGKWLWFQESYRKAIKNRLQNRVNA